jgi:DNA polymerase-3 subunit delta'
MAEFAASAAQGHIGRAKYLATNEEARKTREKILNIPFTIKDIASAFEAANILLELAKEQAKSESEIRDEEELTRLKESYGTTGSRLATGGGRAVKELEKEQKTRNDRMKKDFIQSALIDINNKMLSSLKNQLSNEAIQDLSRIHLIDYAFKNNNLNAGLNANLHLESLFTNFIVKSAKI